MTRTPRRTPRQLRDEGRYPPPRRRTEADVLAYQRRLMEQAARIHAEEIWRAERTRRPCGCDICAGARGDSAAFTRALADALRRRAARGMAS
jgi:hypothetical protein